MQHQKCLVFVLFILQGITCSSGREKRGRAKGLTKSAVGSWLEKSGMALRLCVREVSTDDLQTGTCNIIYNNQRKKDTTADEWEVCPSKSQCVATISEIRTFRTTDSVHHVTSATTCKCMGRERKCRLRSHTQVFYKGTRFEKPVNVGECVGRCKGFRGCRCRPLTTKSTTVKGPNGHQCVETVHRCGCVKSCYRATYKEAFVVLERNATKTSTKLMSEEHRDRQARQTDSTVIDIGRCVGTCSGSTNGVCLYWIPTREKGKGRKKRAIVNSFSKRCLFSTRTRSLRCGAKQTRSETLETVAGTTNVDVIESCGCL